MAWIEIGEKAFRMINFPLVFFNILTNIFYTWSLFVGRGRLSQPLKVLLGYLIFTTFLYCSTFVFMETTHGLQVNVAFFVVSIILVQYTHCALTSYVWLNFYYYMSIVPTKQLFMVWMKKNIKSVIYVALIGDTMLYLVNGALSSTASTFLFMVFYPNQTLPGLGYDFLNARAAFSILVQVYTLLCQLIMIGSSFSTAFYLGKHIRNFAKGAGGLTSPKIQSQVRVTVAGILQGLLYLLYYIIYLTEFFNHMFRTNVLLSKQIFITATTLFFTATTLNLAVSQTIIRQRIANMFGGLKSLCCANTVAPEVSRSNSDMDMPVARDG